MPHHNKSLFILVMIFLFSLTGCAASGNLTNYGSFIQDGGKLIELPIIKGGFNPKEFVDLPDFQTSPTIILFWQPKPDLSEIGIINYDIGKRVEFKASPGKNDVLELRPVNELQAGVYCVAQGDIQKPLKEIDHWCFSVKGAIQKYQQAIQSTQQAVQAAVQANNMAQEATLSVKATQEQQAINLYNKIWNGKDGDEIRNIISNSQQVIKNALEKKDPSILTSTFSPDFDPEIQWTNSNGTFSELIKCDSSFKEKVGGFYYFPDTTFTFIEGAYNPQIYSDDYIGVVATIPEKYKGAYAACTGYKSGSKMRFDTGISRTKICFLVRKNDQGWRIEHFFDDAICPSDGIYRR